MIKSVLISGITKIIKLYIEKEVGLSVKEELVQPEFIKELISFC